MVLAGHATIRTQVMGQDYKRRARPAEVAQMRELVDQAMAEGAFGLSSGLEYEVGTYSDIEEVVGMARAAAAIRLTLAPIRRTALANRPESVG